MFRTLHLMFEEQYVELAQAVDEIAERIRSLGFPAPASYADFAELSTVSTEPGSPDALGMVGALVIGHETTVGTARGALATAEAADDAASADLATRRIDIHEKTAWMCARYSTDVPHLLFVCTGNLCRSPMAEYLARDRLADDTVTFASAGTAAMPGRPASEATVRVMREIGIDVSAHRSRDVWELADTADFVYALTTAHPPTSNRAGRPFASKCSTRVAVPSPTPMDCRCRPTAGLASKSRTPSRGASRNGRDSPRHSRPPSGMNVPHQVS